MTGRLALLGAVPRRARSLALALAALFSLALGFALAQVRALPGAGSPVAARAVPSGSRGLAMLPSSALAPVSAALGAESGLYSFHPASTGFAAFAPALGATLTAGDAGISLRSQSLSLGLSLSSWTFGDSTTYAVRPVAPSAAANRVSYEHGALREWYVNGPAGVEQGFTLAARPAHAQGSQLTLSLAVTGNARASRLPGGGAIEFSRAGAPTLSYGALSVRDAAGRSLPASMSLAGGSLRLRIDASGARYPLTIDPLLKQSGRLTAGEALEGGRLGFSVALSSDGNTAVVGAPGYNAGVAWIFVRDGATWTQQGAALVGSELEGEGAGERCGEEENEPAGQCGFGRSVAISGDGDTVLVGGPRDGHNAGAAWVFVREGAAWSQQGPKLTGFEEGGEGRFGRSVALSADGNTALMGGPSDVGGHGSAWVFTRSAGAWSGQGPKLVGRESEEQGESHFGGSVALSADGSTAIVGSPGDDHYAGALWAFTRTEGAWHQQGSKATVTSAGEIGEGHFGASVSVSADGKTALAGAREDNGAIGAAWVLARSGSAWSPLGGKLTASDETGTGEFGYSVALAGDGESALIGGPRDKASVGAAWSFKRSGGGFSQDGKRIETAEESGRGWFGAGVALDGNGETAIVGSPYDAHRVGSAWAYVESTLPPAPEVQSVSPLRGPRSGGTTVTISGANFAEASAVSFGASSATSFKVNDANSITAVSPAGSGTVDVTVTGPGGASATVEGDHFEYIVPGSLLTPSVAALSPTEGSTAGGTSVTITGSSLAGVSAVKFGTLDASSFTVNSNSSITAIAPAHAAGAVDVTLTSAGGTSQTSKRDLFTYVASAGSSGGGASGAAGGVLSFGASSAGCTVKLISKHIAVQRPSRAALRLLVGGAGRCAGKLRLRVKLRAAHGRFTLKTIGTAVFSVPAGRGAVVKMKLNAAGRRLLARGHGRLNASILITRVTPAPLLAQSASVRLARVKAPKAKPKR